MKHHNPLNYLMHIFSLVKWNYLIASVGALAEKGLKYIRLS